MQSWDVLSPSQGGQKAWLTLGHWGGAAGEGPFPPGAGRPAIAAFTQGGSAAVGLGAVGSLDSDWVLLFSKLSPSLGPQELPRWKPIQGEVSWD